MPCTPKDYLVPRQAYVYMCYVETRKGQVRHQAIVFDAVEPCG